MYDIRGFFSACFAAMLVFSGTVAELSARPFVDSVRVGDHAKKTRFVVDLSEKVSFSVFTLANPNRVVIDLTEVHWRIKPDGFRPGRRITGFRYGLFRSGQSRMVLDVKKPVIVSKAFVLGPSGNRGHRLNSRKG